MVQALPAGGDSIQTILKIFASYIFGDQVKKKQNFPTFHMCVYYFGILLQDFIGRDLGTESIVTTEFHKI